MLPYNTGVLDGAPTGPDMTAMPGGRGARPGIEGDPVGTASDVDTDAAEELFKNTYPKLAGWVRRLVKPLLPAAAARVRFWHAIPPR